MRDLSPLLAPRSIAVVGASSTLTSLAGKPVRFLRDSGLDLTVYPVNPQRDEIGGYRAYPSPAALPEAPDVALVVVPATAVLEAVTALAERGAKAAIVISSGFAEGGESGAAAQRQLADVARAHGMLLLGPNTLGVHDYRRGLPLSFVWYGRRAAGDAGSVAVVSQSGSGMTSLCDRLLDAGLPLGFGIATGNEADLTVVDVLEYLAEQPEIRVIATVFEEVRDGPRFLALCRRLRELGKPLVAMKVGRTSSGGEVVRSHTGALAGSYPTMRSLLRQHGVLEVTDLEHVAPMVAAALPGKFPTVDAVAVVTSSGGAAAMAADRADEVGLRLAELGDPAKRRVVENLPSFLADSEVRNPIDVTAQSMQRPFAMVDIAEALVEDPAVGAVVLAVPSGGGPDGVRWAQRLIELANRSPKPLLSVILSGQESSRLRGELRAGGVPVLDSPQRAIEALQRLHRFAATKVDAQTRSGAEPALAATPIPGRRTESSTLDWLAAYGLPVVEHREVADSDAAVAAAEAIGYPVAVKISSAEILHKTEVGGVVLGCSDSDAVAAATRQVLVAARAARPDAHLDGVTVAPMVRSSLELIAGLHHDSTFGPVVMLGLGGVWAEVLADVTIRSLPLRPDEVAGMIDDLQGAPLLRGARGRAPVDVKAVAAILGGLARIANDHAGSVRSIDLNPVAVADDGTLVVLDAALELF